MVLRCSLLGHDYGEPEVDRERDTRGSEVVVTVQEYEQCARCGTKNVLSENTEVTSAASEDVDADGEAGADDAPSPAGDRSGIDPADADGAESVADADAPGDELPTDENGEPITDDAEILEGDEEDDRERGHGEWPDSDDVGPPRGADEPAAWPDDGPSDEPAADRPAAAGPPAESAAPDDDAIVVDAGAGTTESADSVADAGAERGDSGTGIRRAGDAPTPGESTRSEGVPTEFFCPNCSFVAPDDRGSLRPGDICPECKKGYLGERER